MPDVATRKSEQSPGAEMVAKECELFLGATTVWPRKVSGGRELTLAAAVGLLARSEAATPTRFLMSLAVSVMA